MVLEVPPNRERLGRERVAPNAGCGSALRLPGSGSSPRPQPRAVGDELYHAGLMAWSV